MGNFDWEFIFWLSQKTRKMETARRANTFQTDLLHLLLKKKDREISPEFLQTNSS